MSDSQTKLIEVTLVAYRRVECRCVVRVPSNFTDEQLQAVASELADDVPNDQYEDDRDRYWKQAPSRFEKGVPESEPADYIAALDDEGHVVVRKPALGEEKDHA